MRGIDMGKEEAVGKPRIYDSEFYLQRHFWFTVSKLSAGTAMATIYVSTCDKTCSKTWVFVSI